MPVRRCAGTMLIVACLAVSGAARAQACAPFDRIVAAVLATETRARSDVTDQFACRFPEGMPFDDAVQVLECGQFELPNRTERMFHRWNLPGQEYVSRRRFPGFWSDAEIRITMHVSYKRVVRFSAQYFSGR